VPGFRDGPPAYGYPGRAMGPQASGYDLDAPDRNPRHAARTPPTSGHPYSVSCLDPFREATVELRALAAWEVQNGKPREGCRSMACVRKPVRAWDLRTWTPRQSRHCAECERGARAKPRWRHRVHLVICLHVSGLGSMLGEWHCMGEGTECRAGASRRIGAGRRRSRHGVDGRCSALPRGDDGICPPWLL
jgi:hypothetical protein